MTFVEGLKKRQRMVSEHGSSPGGCISSLKDRWTVFIPGQHQPITSQTQLLQRIVNDFPSLGIKVTIPAQDPNLVRVGDSEVRTAPEDGER